MLKMVGDSDISQRSLESSRWLVWMPVFIGGITWSRFDKAAKGFEEHCMWSQEASIRIPASWTAPFAYLRVTSVT